MDNSKTTVFIVDDDEAVQQSLRLLVETVDANVETYGSGQEFLEAYEPGRAGCLVLDVRMPGMSGLELQSKLVQEGINIPVIIVTGHGDVPMAVEALRAGAVDFIEKPFRDQALLDSIQRAIELDARARSEQSHEAEIESKMALLTPKEREVMELLVVGKSVKQIAMELGSSQKTIYFHEGHVLEKMEVDSVVELVRLVGRMSVLV